MFVLDLETLDIESTAVVLSAALVYFEEGATYESLMNDVLFVKFDVKEQLKVHKRTASKSTLEWWSKQSDLAKKISLIPSDKDISVEEGIIQIKKYLKRTSKDKMIIWSRGSIDSVIIDSLCRSAELAPIAYYNQHREIRTALDLLATTTVNGYCKVDLPGFDMEAAKKNKHDPRVDVVLDAIQLMYYI